MKNTRIALASISLAAVVGLGACQTLAPSARTQPPPQSGQAQVAVAPVPPVAPAQGEARASAMAPSQVIPIPPGALNMSGITVVGEGTIRAEPTIAYVSTGVQTRGQNAQEAQNENTRLMNAVIAAIKAKGVVDQDIRTSGVNLSPVYDRQPNQIAGYQATNTVRVTVQDVKKVGEILDATVQAGANLASNIQFDIKDDTELRKQALDRAVKEARTRADAIAAAAGLRVVGVQSMTDESSGRPEFPEMARAQAMAADSAGPVPVQPGQLAVTARVRVVFAFQ
jgi:uncharacterized protein YggE